MFEGDLVVDKGKRFGSEILKRLGKGEISAGQAVGLDRDGLYRMAQIAYRLFDAGMLDEAEKIYCGLVAADPLDSVFRCHLAAVYHRQGRLDEAYEQYSHSIRLNRANVEALTGRGEILLARGKADDAKRDLSMALKADPKATKPATTRARALLQSSTAEPPSRSSTRLSRVSVGRAK